MENAKKKKKKKKKNGLNKVGESCGALFFK